MDSPSRNPSRANPLPNSRPTTPRVVRDELGEIELPAGVDYGPQTERALRKIAVSDQKAPDALLISLIQLKSAYAKANRALGTLDPVMAQAIEQACEALLSEREREPELWRRRFPLDAWQSGAGTNWNMNANEVIATLANRRLMGNESELAPVRAHDHVNRGQSSNTVIPAAIRLALLRETGGLLHELHLVAGTLKKRAQEWHDDIKPARTHLQDAVPTTLGMEALGWCDALERCRHWIGESRLELEKLCLSAGAAGTGLSVPEGIGEETTRILQETLNHKGLKHSANHGPDFLQSLFAPAHTHAQLALLASELHRICSDIRLLASGPRCGLGELKIPAIHAGSSMMPGKVNPSIPELVSQICFRVQGNQLTVSLAQQNGQLDLNVMTPVLAVVSLESVGLLTQALRLLRTEVLELLQPDRSRLHEHNLKNTQTATALILKHGHKRVGEWIAKALTENLPISEVIPPADWEEAQKAITQSVQNRDRKRAA